MQGIRIPWRESFCSGFHTIDDQHREIITLVNSLMDRLAADCPLTSVRYYLAEIHELIAEHFDEEERTMLAAEFNGATAHKIDHDRLLYRIRTIMDEVKQARLDMSKQQLAQTLDDWFSVHFRTYDRVFHQLSESSLQQNVDGRSASRDPV